MKIITKIAELDHPESVLTGFVPTMGSFHDGHLQLMRTAKTENDRVIVSLFVNPTQFGPNEDFERYPRNLDRDAELAKSVGVDILFAPALTEVYPRASSEIHVPQVTTGWEGAARPGHFDGVATIVCKLFNIVRPTTAYFGLKDLQQCVVITRMVEDLNMPVKLSLRPTVREEDGLAMSSRNIYLNESERKIAPTLYAQLTECVKKIKAVDVGSDHIETVLRDSKSVLDSVGFRVDYLELIDLDTTRTVRTLERPTAIIVAAYLGKTRLIDNILV